MVNISVLAPICILSTCKVHARLTIDDYQMLG